jgi:hypothetical protein
MPVASHGFARSLGYVKTKGTYIYPANKSPPLHAIKMLRTASYVSSLYSSSSSLDHKIENVHKIVATEQAVSDQRPIQKVLLDIERKLEVIDIWNTVDEVKTMIEEDREAAKQLAAEPPAKKVEEPKAAEVPAAATPTTVAPEPLPAPKIRIRAPAKKVADVITRQPKWYNKGKSESKFDYEADINHNIGRLL